MPPDNAAPVAAGSAVEFPEDGPSSGGGISRMSNSTFLLSATGTYQVLFQASITATGQMVLALNGSELPSTVVGRAGLTCQIVGLVLINTTSVNSILSVNNPAGEAVPLVLTPMAGGTDPVSAHLVIMRIQ